MIKPSQLTCRLVSGGVRNASSQLMSLSGGLFSKASDLTQTVERFIRDLAAA